MKDPARSHRLLLFFFLGFLSLFFLSSGADFHGHLQFRMGCGVFLAALFLVTKQKRAYHPAFFLFAGLFLFQAVRAASAFFTPQILEAEGEEQLLGLMIRSPLQYFFYLTFFLLAYSFFVQKFTVSRLLKWMSWNGFFLAANAIPTFLEGGKFGYVVDGSQYRFFHPVFYFHPWVSEYLLAGFTHLNFLGDIMAFGFFPALGLTFYSFHSLRSQDEDESVESGRMRRRNTFVFMLLQIVLALVIGAAILLLFSRGTITFFLIAAFFFFLAYPLKFRAPAQIIFTFLIFILAGGFFMWRGNFQKAWKELQTLEKEADPKTRGSFATNVEGWNRALRISKAYPVFGVGTGGYGVVAKRFATPGLEDKHLLANFQSMCHYVHLLAEEGLGAFFYYLFLLAYLIQVTWGLVSTRSRFKFLMGLSLFAPVLLVLGHAAINDLMQRFSTSMLVYISMGASLAVLRKDFEH